MDKHCDHRLWACEHLLAAHEVYAAADAYAVMRLAEAARAQGPTRLVRPAAAEDELSEDEAAQPTRTLPLQSADGRAPGAAIAAIRLPT